jgi:3-deoxy-D-manno-octulosonic-acid transferase
MLKALYDFGMILLALAWLPKALRGKYKNSLKARLGLHLPEFDSSKSGKIVWIHAVSMGETKAAAALAQELRLSARIIVSSVTETGFEEAKRSISFAEAHFFLPLDFSWTMRKYVQYFKPSVLILVEGEFWYNLIDEAKKSGAYVALVNGKLSERSENRFRKLRWFSDALFSKIDVFCLQNESYKKSFARFIPDNKIFVTGNLKFDMKIKGFSEEEKSEFRRKLGLNDGDFVVVLGSTHEPEETMLLTSLQPLFDRIPKFAIILVPRHPQRFDHVEGILREKGFTYKRYTSELEERSQVVLIDAMGKLIDCFQIASVGVLAGSFIPGIGGHNLFEPASCGIPVLFGPYTEAQKAYAEALVGVHGGISLPAEEVGNQIFSLYQDSSLRKTMGQAASGLVQASLGAAKKTLKVLESKTTLS